MTETNGLFEEETMEKQWRILVVDDDPFERIICRVMLRGEEFIVFGEANKEKALERISREGFDLIVADIRLPDAHGGLTFLQETRMLQPGAHVVVTADRPSIWDAREAVRLGALKYIEKPFVPEFMLHIAKGSFDKKGWVLRKTHIDQFRDYVVPSPKMNTPTLYYKNGSWARRLGEGLWEAGYDMKYWLPSGRYKNEAWASQLDGALHEADHGTKPRLFGDRTLSIELFEGRSALAAGETYARVSDSAGRYIKLQAPMTGMVKEVNAEANDILRSGIPEDLGVDWLLWLARIQTKEEGFDNVQDTKERNLVGTCNAA